MYRIDTHRRARKGAASATHTVNPCQVQKEHREKLGRKFYPKIYSGGSAETASVQQGAKIEVPIDIVIFLLKPDELEKLQQYIASYLAKHGSSEI